MKMDADVSLKLQGIDEIIFDAFEKFLFESMALSSKLDDIKRSLLQDDFAVTVDGVREQLHHHQHVRKWIVKAPIEILAEEANRVVNIIKSSCECPTEEELKDEYKNSMHQVRSMIGTLTDQRTFLKELWISRKGQLEQRFQFNVFKQDAEKMLTWIHENRNEFLYNFTEIGEDLEMAEELREEHKQFEENCGDVQVNIDHILQVANRLQEMQFFDVELIDRLSAKLENEWKKLYTAVEQRSAMLEASVSFHRSSKQFLGQSKIWVDELKSFEETPVESKATLDATNTSLSNMRQTMTDSYEAVSKEAKELLSSLQRSPIGDSREEKARSRLSDYTDAASHVMDVIVIMYEQNKQLNICWEKQKVRNNQKYKLSVFNEECVEILKFIRGNGNSFLAKNSWVGDQLELAEELLAHQDEFEKSFQDTYHKAKKLLETASQLAETKECDPNEIKLKASQLEIEVKAFTSKIKKRRELLKMAVSFFKNTQKLNKATDKLKDELHLETESSAEPQNFDTQLEKHRHECEATLEKLLTTVHEGEKLSAELLHESKSTSKDSKTSWFSAASNSPGQSRLAVELYLKELNHNRQNLEKLWRGRQQKLDYWVKVKHYERDTNTLYLDVNKWNSSWQKKELSSDVTKAVTMVERFENEFNEISERFCALLHEGKELEHLLVTCGIEVVITSQNNIKLDSVAHVGAVLHKLQLEYDVIKKIFHKLKVKYDFSIKQRKLEADAKKVSSWVRHGETILQASQDAGSSMFEAEAILREYERFHVAIETTRLGVMDIRESANKLIREGHPDHITIENVAAAVESKWQLLMKHAEERRGVVFSSYNFYRAADQVGKLLDKFSKDCKSDEDPCEKFADYELKFKREKIEALIKKSEPEKKAVEDGCLKVKESSEEFLRRVLPKGDGTTTPVIDGAIGRLEITVNDLVEQVTSQEAFVLKQIQLRKTVLAGCAEMVWFEENVQETLQLITEQGTVVSDGFKTLDKEKQDEGEKETYLQKQEEYKTIFQEIREKVKQLLKEASDLVGRLHFHRAKISELATSIDMRYKDLACHMKQYRESLEIKLGCTVPEVEDEGEWPCISAFQPSDIKAVTRRDVSNDSGIHEMTEEKRRSVKRIEFIIKELVQTEKAYVDDLKCCIDNFLTPMYNNPDLPQALVGREDVIFGNIELIYQFHSDVFFRELSKYENAAENVGQCFTDWAEKFHMYVEFCANKPDSNTLLIEHGENFFEDLQLKKNLGLSIAAYLIKPVQRITKYQLLLKDLLSCCDDANNTLQAGLDVMLDVPRRANDAMYLCLIRGFNEGSLEALGKILLQDSFTVWDTKHILKKGKERHVFLFEQAVLLCKEVKDIDGKCMFEYKYKLKTSEMGITEHIAEDKCKFAIWTGAPPFTEEKRVIKANSEEVKQMWVREVRELTQQFQFGLITAQTSFYPSSPRRKGGRKCTSQADLSMTSDSSFLNDRQSVDYETATVCSRTSFDNYPRDGYVVTENYTSKGANELSLTKGQCVEVLSRPPGSRSWRVRVLDGLEQDMEGLVPHLMLRKIEDSPLRGKRLSVETLNSQSSEDSFQTESPKGSTHSVSGRTSPKSRRRAKSVNLSSTLKMKTWSRGTARKYGTLQKPPLPTTPIRSKGISGGGSRKLQALLGAPESDIDLLIRPSDGKYATLGRSASKNTERVKFLTSFEPEDAGFQEGDLDSDPDSISDSSDALNGSTKDIDVEGRSLTKRMEVLNELIQSETEYIRDLEILVHTYLPSMIKSDLPTDLKSKEKVIFGNLPNLLTFHKNSLLKDLQKCINSPEKLGSVFLKAEKKFELYIHYCANKPRSAALIDGFLGTFFNEFSNTMQPKIDISEYLMKPVQRIMKYHAMLKDFMKYSARAGLKVDQLTKAIHVMQVIPKKADDVMNVGLLEGFTGNLNNQGKLLVQDSLYVGNAKTQEPPVDRRVFLFEKLLIFSEPFERKSSLTFLIFRHSVQTHTMGLTANYDDDPCKFAVWSKRDSGSSEIYVMTARSAPLKKTWIDAIHRIIEDQYEEAKDLPDDIRQLLLEYEEAYGTYHVAHSDQSSDGVSNVLANGNSTVDSMGQITPANQSLDPMLKHVKLIPLDQAKSLEDLTKQTFPLRESYTVTENYNTQMLDHMSVQKGDIVFRLHREKKSSQFFLMKSASKENSGLVPSKILKKSSDIKNNDEKSDSKLRRTSSFGNNEKSKKDRSKRSKTMTIKLARLPWCQFLLHDPFASRQEGSTNLLRTASLRRKKKDKDKHNSTPKSVLDKLHHHWTSNFDSSDDEVKASESLDRILTRDPKTTFEVSPEFKILPRDVTVEAASQVKLTCTVVSNPPPRITWSKNDETELISNHKYNINFENHLCTFEILHTEPSDTDTYTVTATNSLGSASCSAKVVVEGECKLGVPSKPYATEITSTSISLAWQPPIDSQLVPVHAYSVQYQEADSSNWQVVIPVCHDTSAVIDDLTPGRKYQFRVSANNDVGLSETSKDSDTYVLSENTELSQPASNPYEIHWRENIEEHYNICGELGRGRFSIVKRCVEKSSNKEYAAKIVRRRMLSKEVVESEVAILQMLNHPSIVSVHEIYDAPKGLVIVEQLLAGGRLFDHVVIMDLLTEEIAIHHVRELLLAIQYIHSLSIAHLDIKPENILLTGGDEPKVVLSDFGEAIRLRSVPYAHELSGNPEFAAPEIVAGDTVSLATDMWSVGVVVYVLLSGVSPFYSDNRDRACANVTEIRYRFPEDFFLDISDEAKDFIEELLIRDQAHRPDASECLKLDWIKMVEPTTKVQAPKNRISLSRLAAFNARRRYQYESSSGSSSVTSSQLLSPDKKTLSGSRR
ncbi:triple functional domain protein-like isoform X4 [Hydractinia symbiolongicarpus]|uniref:triple functional domain protein-like isoform X4 n=1 Tax=Hydractinia symbiolongicarpus TaxID=13093 RepID=UPI002549D312|nr:triple functional domain protein-like isoform X4 [Hydractinia symbiolongicarpus]